MSIRLRLALWYGALFALILLLVEVLSYVVHVRGHYDDLDRVLVSSADHHAYEAVAHPNEPHLARTSPSLEVVLRLYDAAGQLVESSAPQETVPQVAPSQLLAAPSAPAYSGLVGLLPAHVEEAAAFSGGSFGLVEAPDQRWRVYVLPIRSGGATIAQLVALTPLGQLDESMQRFQLVLVLLGLAGLAIALGGGWVLAGRALNPIRHMVDTAQSITHSHDLSRRVEQPRSRDEVGQLGETFNEMLSSLEQAVQAQQRFVADASHELRAPLTAIQGNLDLVLSHQEMAATERTEALQEAQRETQRLSRLVGDLLALARADAGVSLKRAPVELDSLVLETFQGARQLAGTLAFALDPFEPAVVEGDADRLRQLLVILLDNAFKYTPADGRVTLGLRATSQGAELLVQDTGAGIPEADLPHIFERFYRVDRARGRDPGGTGLGLPIARWIVEQHGGTIVVQSRPGHGTTVSVRLPSRLSP